MIRLFIAVLLASSVVMVTFPRSASADYVSHCWAHKCD